MFECLFYRWVLYWAMLLDGLFGVLCLGTYSPIFSPLAGKVYKDCILKYGYGEDL